MRKYWLLLILPALLLLWWAIGRGDSAPTVHFAAVRNLTIQSTVSTNGKVEPAEWAAARAEVAGVVKSVDVQRGQQIRVGQALIALDPANAQSELAAALAKQQEAQAELSTLGQGGRAATLANLNDSIRAAQVSIDVARRNYDSLQRMAAQQAATKLEVQQAKDSLEKAQLQLASLQNQKKTLVTASDRSVAQAQLQDAEAALALARRHLALSVVKSPIAGTLYQFDLKVGAYLQPGTLVGMIGNLDQVKVTVYVDEPDLGRIALNMPVCITWDAHPERKWWGRVDKLPTQVISLDTRAVGEVATVVDNPNHDLLPGVTVNVLIISKVVNNALSIPKAALRNIAGVDGAFKLTGDSLAWTPVKTGISDVNNVQVVSGLNLGEQVADRVVEPSDAEIKNAMRVKPVL